MANIELFVRLTYEPAIFLYKIKTHIFFSSFFNFFTVYFFFTFFFYFLLLLGLVYHRSRKLSTIILGKTDLLNYNY